MSKKYYVDREVLAASGTQTFVVTADSPDEARKKFINGESEIYSDDCEVTDLSNWEWDTMYSEEDGRTLDTKIIIVTEWGSDE